MIELNRFCVNRKIAPSLSIPQFFELVHHLGIHKVELRNDMPSGNVIDDLEPKQVVELTNKFQIEIVTINAIYPFNQLTNDVRQLVVSLLKTAQQIGAKGLVMCPLNDGTNISQQQTIDALKQLNKLFSQFNIQGYIEPLGFEQSSLRSAYIAQECINQANVPFKLLIDSFHHYLFNGSKTALDNIEIKNIGLVHLSGVEDKLPINEYTDNNRVMLTSNDILQNCKQIYHLEQLGYQGIYSFEPFSNELINWSKSKIINSIEQSIQLIQNFKH